MTGTATAVVNGQVVNVAGTFSYTGAAGTILNAGKGQSEQVTFTPTDTVKYGSVVTSVVVNVQQAVPGVTWPAPAPIAYGTALGAAQLDVTAGVSGSVAYTPPAGTVLGAGTKTLSATFTPSDVVNYSPVTVTVSLVVNPATPAFTNLGTPTITAGAPSTTLSGRLAAGTVVPAGDSVTVTVNGVSMAGTVERRRPLRREHADRRTVGRQLYHHIRIRRRCQLRRRRRQRYAPRRPAGRPGCHRGRCPRGRRGAGYGPRGHLHQLRSERHAATYAAVITWGDGSTSAGVISGTGGVLTVNGSHTYAGPGTDTIHVTITDTLGTAAPATTTSIATVGILGQSVADGQTKGAEFWSGPRGQSLILELQRGHLSHRTRHLVGERILEPLRRRGRGEQPDRA